MHTVYDWLSAKGNRAPRDGRRNRRQREWPVMSGDTVDCGHQLAHGGHQRHFGGFADARSRCLIDTGARNPQR
jgi:hypothetical protein